MTEKGARFLIIGIATAMLFSCKNSAKEQEQYPGNILKQEEFARLLTDYALAESAANMNISGASMRQFDTVYAFNPLLENKVRPSQYDSTLEFYINHPELYKVVYEKVLENLSRMQTARQASTNPQGSK